MEYQEIKVETRGRVGLVTLHRPKVLNALNSALIGELVTALEAFDADPGVGCILLTGSDKAFAAGADIKEMQALGFPGTYLDDFFSPADRIGRVRKPILAAVAGYALGGGCELALMCDLIIAADTAQFGQPEIKLGVMPGIGGTQRLPRAVGKGKAMDLVLTGRTMGAEEAERSGLVARVVPAARLMEEAMAAAQTIAAFSLPAVIMAKESINRAYEAPLAEGIRFERRLFQALFATADQREGMSAFIEKRPPAFKHR